MKRVAALLLMSATARAADLPPFKLGLTSQFVATAFEVKPILGGTTLRYRPALSNYVGFVLGYKWLGGTMVFAVPAKAEIRDVEGQSKFRDYHVTYYTRRWGIETSYNRYLSYLIENSQSTLSSATLNGQTYYKIPDLETLGYGANIIYVLDPKNYSMPAALDQSEIQATSAGSWILIGSWREQVITSNSPIIPTELQSEYGVDADFQAANTRSIALGGGYSYNWVPGAFFVTPSLAATVGYQSVELDTPTETRTYSSPGLNLHIRLGLGLNHPSSFFMATLYADIFSKTTESLRISNNVQGVALTGGIRF